MKASLSQPTLKNKSNTSKERDLHGLGGWGRNLDGPSRWSLVGPTCFTANPSRQLLAKLLGEVHATALTESAEDAHNGFTQPEFGSEVDIVVSGGGLRGYFVCGAAVVLDALVQSKRIKIRRYAGASAGAWVSMFMASGLHPLDWCETYYGSMNDPALLLDGYRNIIPSMMLKILPDDAYKRCSGRVFISITVMGRMGPRNVIVSEFTSNEDLVNACMASCTIPYITTFGFGEPFRGQRVVDGGFTNNIPLFTDNARETLLFDLGKVAYPFEWTMSASDPCIESLIIRGAVEMRLFCRGHRVAAIMVAQGTESYGMLGEFNKLVRHGLMLYAAWFVALETRSVVWAQYGPVLTRAWVASLGTLRAAIRAPGLSRIGALTGGAARR
mmetsp:Transcript_27949/g.65048  ORF Transcript_27949/g.65048 Transcript_27949/m.65048 type:complete len:385 (+) Transcript_27949:145-1299(+)